MLRTFNAFVNSIVVVLVALFIGSCTNQDAEFASFQKPIVPDTVVNGKNFKNDLTHNVVNNESSASDDMRATCTIEKNEDGKVVDSYKQTANPWMKASIFVTRNNYEITEDQINCTAVSTNILRNQNTNNVSGGVEVTDTVVVTVSDGQVVKLPSTIKTCKSYDGNDEFSFGTVELKSATVKEISNEDISVATRAASSTYVKQTLRTKYAVDLTYAEKGTSKDTSYVVSLAAYATRYVIASNEIASVTVENKTREVIDDNTEKVSFTEVITMNNGETIRNTKSMILNREFKGIDAYEKIVSGFAYSLSHVNGVANGSESQVKNAEGWTVYGKTDNYSANISNGVAADAFSTAYTLYHERATYKDANVEVTFGYETVNVAEAKNVVSNAVSDKTGYDKAIYNNEIRTSYIGYTQNIAEQVYLYKLGRAVSGYDFRNATLVVNDNNVVASLDFVTKYNDGTEEVEKVNKSFARSLKCTSNWKAFENNADQFTHMLNVVLSASKKMNDGAWSWNEETRNITNIADLAASHQTNSWVSVDPNAITYTRNGKTYSFNAVEFNVMGAGENVKLASDEEEMSVYTYASAINVKFGDNTVSSVAPGTIVVAKEIKGDFPAEWGKFVSATGTVSCNEANNNWVYTWSLHFENGTLPVIVGQDADKAVVDQSLFAYDTNSALNSAVFKNGSWINAIAQDKTHSMMWLNSEGQAKNALNYATATMWHWNHGDNTVFNSDFTFSIENNGKKLVVKKNGADFATFRASAK